MSNPQQKLYNFQEKGQQQLKKEQLKKQLWNKTIEVCLLGVLSTVKFSLNSIKKTFSNPTVQKGLNKGFEKYFFEKLKYDYNIGSGDMLVCKKKINFTIDKCTFTRFGRSYETVSLNENDIIFLAHTYVKTPYNKLLNETEEVFPELDDYMDGYTFSGWINIVNKERLYKIRTMQLLEKIKNGDLQDAYLQ